MCTVTSAGEFTEIMVQIFASCMKAWKSNKSALRRALRKCMKLVTSFGSAPKNKDDIDMAIRKCAHAASEHALVDTIMKAMGLNTHTYDTKTQTSGVRYEVRATMNPSGEPMHVCILLSTQQIPVTVNHDGYKLIHSATSAHDAWKFLTVWLPDAHEPVPVVVDPLNLLSNDTFWNQCGF